MIKGQNASKRIKPILKFFKLNENAISTLMGGIVVIVIAGLIFNYFRTTNLKSWQGTLLTEQEAASTVNSENNDKTMATYKVVKGDDLWHISEKFYRSGYNYVDIMKENNIKGDGIIVPGQELKIPKVEAKMLTVIEVKNDVLVKTEIKSDTSITEGTYTTQKGDSYWSIAVRAYGDGFQWTKIYWANKAIFSNPDIIFANTEITIPALAK